MKKLILFFIFLIFQNSITLAQNSSRSYPWLNSVENVKYTIKSSFPPPEGYQRVAVPLRSFAYWLRHLPLLATGTPVKDYRGTIKVRPADSTLAAVIDYPIAGKKLEQCMDIIYRFWAEYLFSFHRYDDIVFYLPGAYRLRWTDWMAGLRPHYKGIQVIMNQLAAPDSSRLSFEKYLWEVFYHSYTQTAYFAYPRVDPGDLKIGDFIVKKGNRGHAVLIVDMAVDSQGNKKILVGHGDTPARHFYILNYKKDQPWFPVNTDINILPFPFKKKMSWTGLRRFCSN